MVRFFFKKSFYDGWDTMFALAGFNGAAIAIAAIGLLVPASIGVYAVKIAGLAFIALAGSIWWATAAAMLNRVADCTSMHLADLRPALKASLKPGLQFGATAGAAVIAASIAFPFYASIGGFFGLFATSLAFWLFASLWLTLQYVLPVRAADGGSFLDAIKASFVLFIDAPLFSLLLALDGALCIALSPVIAFLLPGPAAAVLASCEAVRLRRFRLRWLAESKGKTKPTPWKELLADDAEALGERGLKDFLFPWKR